MRADGRPTAFHASAVAIAGSGLLIAGASKAGKSRLAFALIAASTPQLPIQLIGDDRILMERTAAGRLHIRPHPRIAGFIERRGLGIVALPWLDRAPLGGLLLLGGSDVFAASYLRGLPRRAIAGQDPIDVSALLSWWCTAAGERHRQATSPLLAPRDAKDWNW